MKKRWNIRYYPTPEQEQSLARTFGCARFVYKRFLHERTAAYARGERMNDAQSSAFLTVFKRDPEHAWLNEVSSVPLQQALCHLQTTYKHFFDKRTGGYPSFRRKEGSNRREKARQRVARIHKKITNCRSDHQKQMAWRLLNQYDTIYVEDLNLRGIVKNTTLPTVFLILRLADIFARLTRKPICTGSA